VAQWTTRDGPPEDQIYCTQEDADGRLWASGSQGAFCVENAALDQLLADLQRAALERLVPVLAPTATGASPGAAHASDPGPRRARAAENAPR